MLTSRLVPRQALHGNLCSPKLPTYASTGIQRRWSVRAAGRLNNASPATRRLLETEEKSTVSIDHSNARVALESIGPVKDLCDTSEDFENLSEVLCWSFGRAIQLRWNPPRWALSEHKRYTEEMIKLPYFYDHHREALVKVLVLLENRSAFNQVCYILGHLFWIDPGNDLSPSRLDLAKFTLDVSVEHGGRHAHLDLWIIASLRGVQPNVRTYDAIKEAAITGTDWRAMQLYTDHLLRKPRVTVEESDLAFDIASRLYDMVKPGEERRDTESIHDETRHSLRTKWTKQYYKSPHQLIREASVKQTSMHPDKNSIRYQAALHAYDDSLRIGANQYNDIEAIKRLAQHRSIALGSPEWVSLIGKAAAANDSSACRDYGRYLIETSGWYLCTGQPWNIATGRKGLHWMLLAANLQIDSASNMSTYFTIVALLFKENGFTNEGKRWLKYGKKQLQDTCQDNSLSIRRHVLEMETWENRWGRGESLDQLNEALGAPLLDEEQRQRPTSTSMWAKLFG